MTQDQVIIGAFWIACGLIAAFIAQQRKLEDAGGWFITGVVLGPFGLLWALLKKPPATPQ